MPFDIQIVTDNFVAILLVIVDKLVVRSSLFVKVGYWIKSQIYTPIIIFYRTNYFNVIQIQIHR